VLELRGRRHPTQDDSPKRLPSASRPTNATRATARLLPERGLLVVVDGAQSPRGHAALVPSSANGVSREAIGRGVGQMRKPARWSPRCTRRRGRRSAGVTEPTQRSRRRRARKARGSLRTSHYTAFPRDLHEPQRHDRPGIPRTYGSSRRHHLDRLRAIIEAITATRPTPRGWARSVISPRS